VRPVFWNKKTGLAVMPRIFGDRMDSMDALHAGGATSQIREHLAGVNSDMVNVTEAVAVKRERVFADLCGDFGSALRGVCKGAVWPATITIPSGGDCHGDFTLENLIFHRASGVVFSIDSIPSYIETRFMDYIKIRQDLLYGWCNRWGLRFSVESLRRFDCLVRPPVCPDLETMRVLDAMNVLRIAPYAQKNKNNSVQRWVYDALHAALDLRR